MLTEKDASPFNGQSGAYNERATVNQPAAANQAQNWQPAPATQAQPLPHLKFTVGNIKGKKNSFSPQNNYSVHGVLPPGVVVLSGNAQFKYYQK